MPDISSHSGEVRAANRCVDFKAWQEVFEIVYADSKLTEEERMMVMAAMEPERSYVVKVLAVRKRKQLRPGRVTLPLLARNREMACGVLCDIHSIA